MKWTITRAMLRNVWLALAATLAALGLGETVIRLVASDNMVLFPRYQTDARYGEYTLRKLRPNMEFWHTSPDGRWKFTTNANGFRDYDDFSYEKPSGTIRVLVLGDSHTEGFEVRQEHTFAAIIERYLKREGLTAEVMNAGISGFSTAEELIFLENEGIKFAPDFVVVGFFANDFEDNIKSGLFEVGEQGDLIVRKKTHIPGVRIQNLIYSVPFVKWLGEHSYLYSLAFNTVWQYFKAQLADNAAEDVFEYAVTTQDGLSEHQLSLTMALVRRMYSFCVEHDVKLVILDIPRTGESNEVMSSVPDRLRGFFSRHADAFLPIDSTLSDFRGVAELHVPRGQRHLSELGHALLGVATGRRIRGLIKSAPSSQ